MNTAEKIARMFFDSTSEHMIRINKNPRWSRVVSSLAVSGARVVAKPCQACQF